MRRHVILLTALMAGVAVGAVPAAVEDRFDVESAIVRVLAVEARDVATSHFVHVKEFAPSGRSLGLVEESSLTDLLLDADLGPGRYDALHIIAEPESIVVEQGDQVRAISEFKGPRGNGAGQEFVITIKPDLIVGTEVTADLVLEVDWSDVFIPQGDTKSIAGIKSFRIKPVARAANSSVNGTIEFTTFSDEETPDDQADDVPLAGVTYEIFDDTTDPLALVARGISSGEGHVRHGGIPAGTYRLQLTPPKGYAERIVDSVGVIAANLTDLGNITLTDIDIDDDGHPVGVDCNDNNDLWWMKPAGGDSCALTAYACDASRQTSEKCHPGVSNVEAQLNALHEDATAMDWDKHSWASADERPGRPYYVTLHLPWSYPPSQKHLQSIQYIDAGPSSRFIVTSMSDKPGDGENESAIQLVKTGLFGSETGDLDTIAHQVLLGKTATLSRFNHPGGAQLIGRYLFLALEDLQEPFTAPATGVWRVDPQAPELSFAYVVPTHPDPDTVPDGKHVEGIGDRHQATTAVTRLDDGTFLLASCVYEECDFINFFKSRAQSLHANPHFQFVDQWHRTAANTGPEQWSDCPPQNMNFVTQSDGSVYLVMFGGEGASLACDIGTHDDHLYGYEVAIEPDAAAEHEYNVTLAPSNKVDVIPDDHKCYPGMPPLPNPFSWGSLLPELHGMNFLAGSGLWIRPDGKDTIAFLATEHYDSCDSKKVNGKTRWGVSENWD